MDQKALENELKDCKVRQGPLYKRSKFLKEWRERWVVLTINYLFTFTNKSCKEVTDIIDLKEIRSYKSYLKKSQEMIPAGFKVRTEDQEFYFCGRNCNQKWSWIVTLQRLMDYKYVGSSTYNNIEFVKTRGFLSQIEFQNGGKVEKTFQPNEIQNKQKKTADQAKKQVDDEVEKIMKELENQKQHLKQKQLQFHEKQKILKEHQQAFKKQQQEKIKQLEKQIEKAIKSPKKVEEIPTPVLVTKTSETISSVQQKQPSKIEQPKQVKQFSQVVSSTAFGPKVSDLKSLYEQKMRQSVRDSLSVPNTRLSFNPVKLAKKKSIAEELHSLRSRTVTNLFEEFHNQNPDPEALAFTLDFLVKMASDPKFGYYSSIVVEVKSHKNRKFLAETFVELITDYKDLKNCDLVAKFIEICVFQAPGFFDIKQISIIQNKLIDFFLAVEDETKIEVILKNMFIVNKMNKYSKNEVVKAKITRITKESRREENKNWARKLVDEF